MALQVVSLRTAEGSGRAKIAQVIGTVNDSFLAAFQREERPLGGRWVMMMVVMVERWLLKRPSVFGWTGNGLQYGGELVVASLTVGAAVSRLAPVASFSRWGGDLWAGR